ncbi:MAG: hypothetical protein ACE5Z5_12395 [Candidatus Bathyarchaeia archaeon]
MSVQPFTLKVKMGNNEVELSGSMSDVLKALDDLPQIVGKVNAAFGSTPTAAPITKKAEKRMIEGGYPTISVSSAASCPEVIVTLLATDWGRRAPRRMRELVEAMKVNALHFPVGTVKGRLTDLTKKGVLRRIRTGRGYGYILIKPP